VPLNVLRSQIASAVDTIVQVTRGSDGSRYVTHVSQVRGHDRDSGYRLHHVFERTSEFGSSE